MISKHIFFLEVLFLSLDVYLLKRFDDIDNCSWRNGAQTKERTRTLRTLVARTFVYHV